MRYIRLLAVRIAHTRRLRKIKNTSSTRTWNNNKMLSEYPKEDPKEDQKTLEMQISAQHYKDVQHDRILAE